MNSFAFLLLCVAVWMNRNQQGVIEYLQEKIRILFQKVRKRGNLGAHVKRHEKQAQRDQFVRRQPLEIAHEEARIVTCLCEADEMQSGDVRDEQRQTNGGPTQRIAAQKIAPRLAVLAFAQAHPNTSAHDASEAKDDDDEVNGTDVFHALYPVAGPQPATTFQFHESLPP